MICPDNASLSSELKGRRHFQKPTVEQSYFYLDFLLAGSAKMSVFLFFSYKHVARSASSKLSAFHIDPYKSRSLGISTTYSLPVTSFVHKSRHLPGQSLSHSVTRLIVFLVPMSQVPAKQ